MSRGSPLRPVTLLPFVRPPQASGGTGSGRRAVQQAFMTKGMFSLKQHH